MKTFKKVAILSTMIAPLMLSLTSCDDLFNPAPENFKGEEDLKEMPSWAAGLLAHAYISNPLGNGGESYPWSETATDDAVSNDVNNGFRKIAGGAWRKDNNPLDQWQHLRASMQYINLFLKTSEDVTWAADEVSSKLYKMRFQGDAYGMRALYIYHLLRAHAGWTEDGKLLGVPILTEPENVTSQFNYPRNTFQECIAQIDADVNKAVELLPEEYGDVNADGDVPAKYQQLGAAASQYNRVFGVTAKNRMSARIAKAVRAQAYLLAASPAFAEGSGVTWEQAAKAMADVCKYLGSNPVSQLDPKGDDWFTNADALKNLANGQNTNEWLWRTNAGESSGMEEDNFPPTMFGKGRINPSQNLVDAFPMANGYPISAAAAKYDAQNPYADRDPRLAKFIVLNKSMFGGKEIVTAVDGTDNNAMDKKDGESTRTGYYMRKLLNGDVNCNPTSKQGKHHIKPLMRFTEFFLGFAEAANEAWGPRDSRMGFSAYDVMKAIRERAGICANVDDPYLNECAADKDKMRELIHNERRIELCFEGFRFWDLRRWKADLNETVKGMKITGDPAHYEVVDVETRSYKDYMYWGPIPYSETLKYDQLQQNKGW